MRFGFALAVLMFALPAWGQHDGIDRFSREDRLDVASDARSEAHTGPSAPMQGGRRWYGWQTLAFDAASVGSMAAGVYSSEGLFLGGFFGYLFGGPIVHGAHAHSEKALGSFALRLFSPIVGGIVGAAAANCGKRDPHADPDYDRCGGDETFQGITIGALFAVTLDAVVLANEDVPGDPRPAKAAAVLPEVRITKDRAVFSLGGRF